jgi:large subunit ribosomal protein L31
MTGETGAGSLDGSAVGTAELETSGLEVAPGTGGGGGVPGPVCATETALMPRAVRATAANAIVRRFKSTPRIEVTGENTTSEVTFTPADPSPPLRKMAPSGRGCAVCYNRRAVKNKIHPKWYPEAKVSCACGSTFTTGSTLPTISVEICSACHPLFTGQQKFIDTAGRVDKFNQRVALADKKKAEAKARKQKKDADEAAAAAV